jgi:hypothetical protein
MRPDDEKLMAYADDALAPAERAEIEDLVRSDPEAKRIVEAYQESARLARLAYAEVATEAIPDRLVQAALGAEARSDNIVPLAARRKSPSFTPSGYAVTAMAACLALVIGAGGGAWFGQRTSGGISTTQHLTIGAIAPGTATSDLLEKRPSGAEVALGTNKDAHRLSVLATFRDRSNRICREVEVIETGREPTPVAAGVACRDPQAKAWTIVGAAEITASVTGPNSDGYAPSGGAEGDVLKGLMNALGAESVLTPDDERALIERNWQ